jgi:hypothetical protein
VLRNTRFAVVPAFIFLHLSVIARDRCMSNAMALYIFIAPLFSVKTIFPTMETTWQLSHQVPG